MKKKRTSNEQPLKEVIDDLLKIYKIEGKYRSAEVVAAYKKIVGTAVVRQTSKMYWKDEVLFITIDSSIIKNEFSYSKDRLIQLINADLGKELVKEIRIF